MTCVRWYPALKTLLHRNKKLDAGRSPNFFGGAS